jgi:hypothetical protein
MAQPFLENLGSVPLFAGQRTHRVIVVDGSMSLNYARAGRSLFEDAREFADGYIRKARRGDVLSLVVMADPPRVVIGAPSPNLSEVRKEVADLRPRHGTVNLPATLAKVLEVLAASDVPQKEVLFLTDLQATTWRGGETVGEDLRRALTQLESRKASSIVVDLGEGVSQNHAVTDIALNTPVVVRGGPATIITATARNFGKSTERGIVARLLIDGRMGPQQTIDLPPGEDVAIGFPYSFEAPGDHVVEVRLDDDPQPVDNARRLVVPVRENIRVLLVDGDFRSEPFQAETDYLAQALNPASGSDKTPSLIRTDVIAESQLSRRDLAPYDAVVLCNLAQVNESELGALLAHLRRGGGLVIFTGDRVLPESYNRMLFAGGKGLLPAEIGEAVGEESAIAQSAFEFDPKGFVHPIVRPYEGTTDAVLAGLTGVKTWKYHRLKVPEGSGAAAALGFTSGDPAIVEAAHLRGRVYLVATSADAAWSSWPLHPSYPPMLEQIVLQSASGRLAQRNVRVGESLEQTLPAGGSSAPASVIEPDGRLVASKLEPEADASRFVFPETELAGTYVAKVGPPIAAEFRFAANTDPGESDLGRLDAAALREALPGWTFQIVDPRRGDDPESAGAVARRGELHRSLLYGVLALLLIESLLAFRLGQRRG